MRWTSLLSTTPLWLSWIGFGHTALLTNSSKAVFRRAPGQAARFVFRGDFRSPAEIREQGGFRPQGEYERNGDAFIFGRHIDGEHTWELVERGAQEEWQTAYVSASTDRAVAASYGEWFYMIAATPNVIDPEDGFDSEAEVLALGGFHWSQVVGYYHPEAQDPDVPDAPDSEAHLRRIFEEPNDERVIDLLTRNPDYREAYGDYTVTLGVPPGLNGLSASATAVTFMNSLQDWPSLGWHGSFPLQFQTYASTSLATAGLPLSMEEILATGINNADIPISTLELLGMDNVQQLDCARLVSQLMLLYPHLGSRRKRDTTDEPSCSRLVTMVKEAPKLQVCRAIDRLIIEYETSDDYEAGIDDSISLEFSPAGENSSISINGGSLPGSQVTLNVEMESLFGRQVVAVRDVNYLGVRSSSAVQGAAGTDWKLHGITLKARCAYSFKNVAVDKFGAVDEVLRHPDGKRDEIGDSELLWHGRIAIEDWHEMKGRPNGGKHSGEGLRKV